MNSSNDSLVDTYPSFLRVVQAEEPISVEQWIACWEEQYMALWPALHEMVLADYEEPGEDWRQIAREMIFPGMNDRLPAIHHVYQSLNQIITPVEEKARHSLDFREDVVYVLYVGLGNGAGWVTKYEGRWAVLFGLEGIVDSGFDPPDQLSGLVAHELGHVVHHSWREARGLDSGLGPWWQLYEEGFAQHCEAIIMAGDSWHMRTSGPDDDWLAWCRENRAWLAAEFLRVADQDESVRPFFGSWYHLQGHKQTGYFLGREVIDFLAEGMTLKDIALLKNGQALEETIRDAVHVLANS